jgi:hypothetical protein
VSGKASPPLIQEVVMNKLSRLIAAGTAVAATALLVTPVSASAEAQPTGSDFGRHVAHCAQTMGFDGTHNPGMHQGFSGWDGMPC